MSTPELPSLFPEAQFAPEEPGPFRIGEVIIHLDLVAEDGSFLPEYHGMPFEKRVVTDIYQGGDTANNLITATLNESETAFKYSGSTDQARSFISTGEILSTDRQIELMLDKNFTAEDPISSPDPRIRGRAKLFVLNTVEQIIADKIAHGEPVSDTAKAINHNRRVRDDENRRTMNGGYLMCNRTYFFNPELLAELDTDSLLTSLNQ